ncbi:MAG: zf-HC2 domain-containing protein [Gemmatimonadota bacterium]
MNDMIDCDAVMRQLWDYLDGELTPERMAAIREHLAMCRRCYPQFEFERSFEAAVAEARLEHSNPGRVRELVLTSLHAKGFAAA